MKKFKNISILLTLIIAAIIIAFFFSFKKTSVEEILPPQNQARIENKKSINHPDSIPTMSEKQYDGSDLKLEKVLDDNQFYTRYSITYKSEGLKISGIMNVPKGKGPFPILILNHGFIEPQNYTNGQGLKREQDFFAKNGFIVLHSDYRNYGYSDFDPNNDFRPRSGYVEDVINAIEALKKSSLTYLDKENIGMLGHSMGGGITLNVMVIKPAIAKAYVLFAPINSDYQANFDRWVKSDWPQVAEQFYDQYGTPEENPELWKSISAKYYLDKISQPVMIHQGLLDEDVPVQWSRDLFEDLQEKNKNVTYFEYPKEGHTFIDAQPLVMERTLEFFDKNLKKK